MIETIKKYAEEDYRDFTRRHIPNIAPGKILGVRIPTLRKIAKENKEGAGDLMKNLPHRYHEENIIHALLINEIKDPHRLAEEIYKFSSHIDNWAVTDAISPRTLKNKPEPTRTISEKLLDKEGEYQKRLGIILMMRFLQGEGFLEEDLEKILKIKSDFYYVNMVRAWYIAELASKREELVRSALKKCSLDTWTQNKAIQKIKESRKIAPQVKKEFEAYKG